MIYGYHGDSESVKKISWNMHIIFTDYSDIKIIL